MKKQGFGQALTQFEFKASRYGENTKHIDIRDGDKTEFKIRIAANTICRIT